MKYYNYLAATIWLAGPQNSALLKVPAFSQRVVKLVAFNSNPWDVHERILSVYLDISKDLCYLRIMLIKDLAVRIFLLPTMLNQTKIHSNACCTFASQPIFFTANARPMTISSEQKMYASDWVNEMVRMMHNIARCAFEWCTLSKKLLISCRWSVGYESLAVGCNRDTVIIMLSITSLNSL